jgi:hypothetical protein
LLLFGILLIFTGLQLITLGLLAELQSRTYHESQDKPVYYIREIRETPSVVARPATAPLSRRDETTVPLEGAGTGA